MPVSNQEPFIGPRPFESQEDAQRFFGRERESRDLLSLVIADSEVLLFAQSGAGKTSLLNAGVIPQARARGFEVLPIARPRGQALREVTPGQISNIFVFNTLSAWAGAQAAPAELADVSLATFLQNRERKLDEEGAPALRIIVFDQFEELFTSHPDRVPDRKGFFEQVSDALQHDRRLRIVFSMREEYLAELEPYVSILPGNFRTRLRLERLRAAAALAAVTGPLKDTPVSFGPGVAENLVDELLKVKVVDASGGTRVIHGEYVEPVQLQVVCQNLWRNLPAEITEITDQHRQAFGNADRALEEFYCRCLAETARVSAVSERQVRRWFQEVLITPAGTRDSVWMGKSRTGGLPNKAVRKLEELHVIRGEERQGRGHWYELTHDRLVDPVLVSNQIWRRHRRRLWQRWSMVSLAAALLLLVLEVVHLRVALRSAEDAQTKSDEVEKLSSLASAYHDAGKNTDAIEVYKQAIALDPTNANLLSSLGVCYHNNSNETEAIIAYQQAIEIDPKLPYPHGNLADIYFAGGDYSNAMAEYKEGIRLAPHADYPIRGLANVYIRLKNQRAALEVYIQACGRDPANAAFHVDLAEEYVHQGNYLAAVANYERAITLKPTNFSYYYNLADVHVTYSNREAAITNYQKAINCASAKLYLVHALADVYRSTSNYEATLQVYQSALKLNPRKAAFYAALAAEYQNQGYYPEVVTNYKQATTLEPTNFVYFYHLAGALQTCSNREAALDNYQRAIDLAPDRLYLVRAKAGVYRSVSNYDACLQVYQRALELNPTNAAFYAALAGEYWEQRRYGAAVTNYEQAIRRDPSNAAYYNDVGSVYWMVGDLTNAVVHYQQAVDRKPQNIDFRSDLADALVANDRTDEAIAELLGSIELVRKESSLEGEEIALHVRLGNIYADLGRYGAASNAFTQASLLEPTVSEPYRGLARVYSETGQRLKAVAALNKAIEVETNNATNYETLGQIHLDYGEFSNAVPAFLRATSLDPTNSSFWFDLGNAYWFLKLTNESAQAFSQARTIDPNDANARNGLGYVYLLMNDWTNAAKQFTQVILLATNSYAGYFNLAMVCALEGNSAEAHRLWQEALERCKATTVSSKLDQALLKIASGQTLDEADPGLVELRKILADNRPPGLLRSALVDAEYLQQSPLKLPGIEPAIRELRQALDRAQDRLATAP